MRFLVVLAVLIATLGTAAVSAQSFPNKPLRWIVPTGPGSAVDVTARSAPDGHTLFQAVVNNALNDLLMPDDCCRLNEKLVPVTRLVSTPLVMVVHPSVPANSVKEYVALAKSKPNQLTYASGGNGARSPTRRSARSSPISSAATSPPRFSLRS